MADLARPTMNPRWLKMRHWRPDWVQPVFAEFERCRRGPGWNPKMVSLGDVTMIDLCGSFVPEQIRVIDYRDDPFLVSLPKNAPRATKALYRRENMLKALRATDAQSVIRDLDRAYDAWEKYCHG